MSKKKSDYQKHMGEWESKAEKAKAEPALAPTAEPLEEVAEAPKAQDLNNEGDPIGGESVNHEAAPKEPKYEALRFKNKNWDEIPGKFRKFQKGE